MREEVGPGICFFKDDREARQWESLRESLIEDEAGRHVKPGACGKLSFLGQICPGDVKKLDNCSGRLIIIRKGTNKNFAQSSKPARRGPAPRNGASTRPGCADS